MKPRLHPINKVLLAAAASSLDKIVKRQKSETRKFLQLCDKIGNISFSRKPKESSMKNEHSSEILGRIAARCLGDPASASHTDIAALAGSVLTQLPDHPKPKKNSRRKRPTRRKSK